MQGHYYCLAPKVSSIFSATTAPPFSGPWGIRTSWVYTLYADGKMTAAQAKSEVVKYRRDVGRLLHQIDEAERAVSAQQLQWLLRDVDLAQAARALPRRRVPVIEDLFLSQFHVFRDRRKFLVLTGPSGMGKTEYIRALAKDADIIAGIRARSLPYRQQWLTPGGCPFPPGEGLMKVSVAGGASQLPDIRELSPLKHAWLFVDEGTPDMALQHRRLFQGKSGCASAGQSAKNCHAYVVVSWGVRIVICCNDWCERSAALSPTGKEWLACNAIVVDVSEPLWCARFAAQGDAGASCA
jgi:hypothetical protein